MRIVQLLPQAVTRNVRHPPLLLGSNAFIFSNCQALPAHVAIVDITVSSRLIVIRGASSKSSKLHPVDESFSVMSSPSHSSVNDRLAINRKRQPSVHVGASIALHVNSRVVPLILDERAFERVTAVRIAVLALLIDMIGIDLEIDLAGGWMLMPDESRTSALTIRPVAPGSAITYEEAQPKFTASAVFEVLVKLQLAFGGVL